MFSELRELRLLRRMLVEFQEFHRRLQSDVRERRKENEHGESRYCLDGNHVKAHNPSLVELVSVLDEAEELLHRGDLPADR